MTRRLSVCGLTLESELELPELVPDPEGPAGPPEVRLRLGPVASPPQGADGHPRLTWASPEEFRLELEGVARAQVSGGEEIRVEPAPGAPPEAVRLLLLGPALGALLLQRGRLVLHASAAVDPSGRAWLLVGPSGSGKSTAAAGLARRGWRLLSEELACLETDGPGVRALPTFPRVRLWSDAVRSLGLDPQALPPSRPGQDRRDLDLSAGFSPEPAQVAGIVFLSPWNEREPRADRVTPLQALPRLIAQTYRHRFLDGFGRRGLQFTQAAAVSRQVPAWEVRWPQQGGSPGRLLELLESLAAGRVPPSTRADAGSASRGAEGPPRLPGDPPRRGIWWLASYPKSGNTWMRSFLSNYLEDGPEPVRINRLEGGSIASARVIFDEYLGLEASDLLPDELERARPQAYAELARQAAGNLLVKVHDAWTRTSEGRPLFPAEVTAGVILIVRDPLDVAVSYAHHSAIPVERVVQVMGSPAATMSLSSQRLSRQLPQLLLDWSGHAESWLGSGLPLCLVRYEDMLADPIPTFGRVVRFLGLPLERERLERALAASSFRELQAQERRDGFREGPSADRPFFRRGEAGAWREELPDELAERLRADHGPLMARLGYLPRPPGG